MIFFNLKLTQGGRKKMKRFVLILITSLVLVSFCFSAVPGKKEKETTPWKKLKEQKELFKNIQVLDTDMDTWRSEKIVKAYYIEYTNLRKALENILLDQTVSMDLFSRGIVADLGEFTPTVKIEDGKKIIDWSCIPKGKVITIHVEQPRPDSEFTQRGDANFLIPNPCTIRFKDQKGKVKARATITFYY